MSYCWAHLRQECSVHSLEGALREELFGVRPDESAFDPAREALQLAAERRAL